MQTKKNFEHCKVKFGYTSRRGSIFNSFINTISWQTNFLPHEICESNVFVIAFLPDLISASGRAYQFPEKAHPPPPLPRRKNMPRRFKTAINQIRPPFRGRKKSRTSRDRTREERRKTEMGTFSRHRRKSTSSFLHGPRERTAT